AAASPESQFLVFIDADCSIKDPDHFFTVCLDHFARDPKLNALCVARRVLPELETAADRVIFDLYNDYFWFMNNVIHFNMSAGEMQMVRRSAFISVGGYNSSLVASEDVDLFQRLGKTGKVRYEKGLVIYHTGRRGHAIGWPKLLSQWFLNSIWMMVLGRAFTKEWEPIRTADKTSANRHP
ncbi:MAG: hypothetical protein KGJ33_01605, partial [Patescibacteria group bacterium]|nr:hypothetical protein [Patescibacteria group bacterium]